MTGSSIVTSDRLIAGKLCLLLLIRYSDSVTGMPFAHNGVSISTGCSISLACIKWIIQTITWADTWWRHQMETFSALLALCAGNSPVTGEFPHKGQWRGALMFYLICACTNGWVNNLDAGDLRRHRAHYDVTVMRQNEYSPFLCVSVYRHIFHPCLCLTPFLVLFPWSLFLTWPNYNKAMEK